MAAVTSKSAAIRAKLDHPIIDSDGHLIEVIPVLHDYIRAEGRRERPPTGQEERRLRPLDAALVR